MCVVMMASRGRTLTYLAWPLLEKRWAPELNGRRASCCGLGAGTNCAKKRARFASHILNVPKRKGTRKTDSRRTDGRNRAGQGVARGRRRDLVPCPCCLVLSKKECNPTDADLRTKRCVPCFRKQRKATCWDPNQDTQVCSHLNCNPHLFWYLLSHHAAKLPRDWLFRKKKII